MVEGVIPEKCLLVAHGLLWKIENIHLCVCVCPRAHIHTHKTAQGQMGRGVKGVVLIKTASWGEMSPELDFEQ